MPHRSSPNNPATRRDNSPLLLAGLCCIALVVLGIIVLFALL